jgi:hypothetical protein
VIKFRFGKGQGANDWGVRIEGLPGVTGTLEGPVETTLTANGVKARVGLYDEPFFFDLIGFRETRSFGTIRIRNDRNFFDGQNDTALVLEIPDANLGTIGSNLDVWGQTLRFGGTCDASISVFLRRAAMLFATPLALTAVLAACGDSGSGSQVVVPAPLPSGTGTATPTPTATAVSYNVDNCFTQTVQGQTGVTATLQSQIIPDTLKLDITRSTRFPNGRHPADPVVDILLAELFLDMTVTGQGPNTFANIPLNPPTNDKPFSLTFPFLAIPTVRRLWRAARDRASTSARTRIGLCQRGSHGQPGDRHRAGRLLDQEQLQRRHAGGRCHQQQVPRRIQERVAQVLRPDRRRSYQSGPEDLRPHIVTARGSRENLT